MRGRPRKPTTMHLMQGTFRADRHGGAEIEGEPLRNLRVPSWLDKYARECWKAHAPWLQKNGLLKSVEVLLFASVCERYSIYRRACDELRTALTHDSGANGNCAKPQVAIAKTAFDQFKTGLQEFGLSPATREKVKAVRTRPPSKLDKYLFDTPRRAL